MTHCVNLTVPAHYKFYVEDDECDLEYMQLAVMAKAAVLLLGEAQSPEEVGLVRDVEAEIEEHDIKISDIYSF